MRPTRFVDLMSARLADQPAVTHVSTLAESGDDRHPIGLTLDLAAGPRLLVQVTAQGAPGDRYSEPEQIVEGEPITVDAVELPTAGQLRVAHVEQWLAAQLAEAAPRELAAVDLYGVRAQPGAVRHGFTATFYSQGRLFVYFLHALRQGQTPHESQDYQVPDVL